MRRWRRGGGEGESRGEQGREGERRGEKGREGEEGKRGRVGESRGGREGMRRVKGDEEEQKERLTYQSQWVWFPRVLSCRESEYP